MRFDEPLTQEEIENIHLFAGKGRIEQDKILEDKEKKQWQYYVCCMGKVEQASPQV